MRAILALLAVAWARVPTAEYIFACNDSDHALAWIDGAQDEAILLTMALFGGVACNGTLVDGCYEVGTSAVLDAPLELCVSSRNGSCVYGNCSLSAYPVLTTPVATCCDTAPPPTDTGVVPSAGAPGCVDRSVREWLAVGFGLLEQAEDAYDAGTNYTAAESLACAAEFVLSAINALPSFATPFVADGADYRHYIERRRESTYAAFSFASRGRRSYRRCPVVGQCTNHTLIATVVTLELTNSTHPTDGLYQLLWPAAGTLAAFDQTHLPHNAQCSLSQAPPGLANVASWRLADLGLNDYARVAQGFTRCDGLPRDGNIRSVYNLRPGQCCNTLTLLDDIEASYRALPNVNDSTPFSFVYFAHLGSSYTYEAGPDAINTAFVLRKATADRTCTDATATAVTSLALLAGIERSADKPLTLAPGESQCVGGDAAGKSCTALNECGAGLACRLRPGSGSRAYCFDGTGWNSAMPCSLAAQCPYGECYGAVSGDAGGQFPFLHVWRANNCDDPTSATTLCADPRVRNWHLSGATKK